MKTIFFAKPKHHRNRCLLLDSLEQRHLLAADIMFSEAIEYRAGVSPFGVTVGDWNGDNVEDLAVANFGLAQPAGDVSALMGTGEGTFDRQVRYEANNKPGSIDNFDVDNDGHLDLIVANVESNDVSVLLNQGDGTFTKQADYDVGLFPAGVQMVDLNNNGRIDIVVGVALRKGSHAGEIVWLPGNGDGTFGSREKLVSGNRNLGVIDDLNGDGNLDLVVKQVETSTVNIHLRGNDGSYGDPIVLSPTGPTSGVASGDFNADGYVDLALAHHRGREVSVYLGKGNGLFHDATLFPAGTAPSRFITEDFDLDGDLDFVVTNQRTPDLSRFNILVNDGRGGFENRLETRVNLYLESMTVADLNNDGLSDIVIAAEQSIAILFNQTELETSSQPGDVNGDGRFDSSDLVEVFRAGEYEDAIDGNSTFEEGDWDGDGDFTTSDLVLAFREGNYVAAARLPIARDFVFENDIGELLDINKVAAPFLENPLLDDPFSFRPLSLRIWPSTT